MRGVSVTGVDLTPDRVAGAAALSQAVGLLDRVEVLEGSVTDAPLADAAYDAVVSQEAFLHIPDKAAALAEAARVLRPGGRLALTDVTAPSPLSDEDADLLHRGLHFTRLYSEADYRAGCAAAGFQDIEIVDLSAEWAGILKERLTMYLALSKEAEAAGAPAGDEWFHRAYPRFVALIAEGGLRGARVSAQKPN